MTGINVRIDNVHQEVAWVKGCIRISAKCVMWVFGVGFGFRASGSRRQARRGGDRRSDRVVEVRGHSDAASAAGVWSKKGRPPISSRRALAASVRSGLRSARVYDIRWRGKAVGQSNLHQHRGYSAPTGTHHSGRDTGTHHSGREVGGGSSIPPSTGFQPSVGLTTLGGRPNPPLGGRSLG